jgi:hypothetical protein
MFGRDRAGHIRLAAPFALVALTPLAGRGKRGGLRVMMRQRRVMRGPSCMLRGRHIALVALAADFVTAA